MLLRQSLLKHLRSVRGSSARFLRPNWIPGSLLAGSLLVAAGCATHEEVRYPGETSPSDAQYYLDKATRLDYAHVESDTVGEAASSLEPRTILEDRKDEVQNMTLSECLQQALLNSRVIRSKGAFLSPGNPLLSAPNNVASIYDPAIQETGVLFGGRGVEAALAAFDAQLSTSMIWGRNEQVQNNIFGAGVLGGNTFVAETGAYQSSLSKSFGYGGSFELRHNVNYAQTNSVSQFASVWTGVTEARYRHPLLAGSGTEFTRIAGPISGSFGGLTGVTQGVIIARINQDIELAALETDLTGLVRDVEQAYWELYLQYRIFDTNVAARNSALRTWRDAKRKRGIGGVRGFAIEDEAQARDRYFDTRAQTQTALSALYQSEAGLRRLIGLPVNDGYIIRPADEPMTARLQPDWTVSIAEGLTHRVELRSQKWNIKSLELQKKAAQNLVRPRLDFIASYSVNGFGNDLIDYDNTPFSSMYGAMIDGDQTSWGTGFVLEMPLGLRSARAQVRNIELRLAKARDVLAAQEQEVVHELGSAYQQLAESYVTAQTYFNRREAAKERAEVLEKKYNAGTETLDLLLRAQASLAEAEVAYYRALVSYNLSIANLNFRQGTLLPLNNVFMAEGEWSAEAYADALRRARERTWAADASGFMTTEPEEFVETDPHWSDTGFAAHSEAAHAFPMVPEIEDEPSSTEPAAAPQGSEPVPAKPEASGKPPLKLEVPAEASAKPAVPLNLPDVPPPAPPALESETEPPAAAAPKKSEGSAKPAPTGSQTSSRPVKESSTKVAAGWHRTPGSR